MAKVPIPAERIFSQAESGRPKTEVLVMLEARHPGTHYHFVEDKFGTLEKVLSFCHFSPISSNKPHLVSSSNVFLPFFTILICVFRFMFMFMLMFMPPLPLPLPLPHKPAILVADTPPPSDPPATVTSEIC
jgi:hypothetical protein